MDTITTRSHHPLSPSNWPFWAECPKYTSDKSQDNSEAKAGTDSHSAFAEACACLNDNAPIIVDDEAAIWAANKVAALGEGAYIHTEDELLIPLSISPTKRYVVTGYCDAWCISPTKTLVVVDYKSGAKSGIDYASQVEGYAIGVINTYKLKRGEHYNSVCCAVIYGADRHIDSWGMSESYAQECCSAIVAARLEHANAKPKVCLGCKYCVNRNTCPAMTALVSAPDTALPALPTATRYYTLSALKSYCEKEMEAIAAEVKASPSQVLEDDNYKFEVRQERGRMKSIDIPALHGELAVKGVNIPQYDMMSACTITKKAFTTLAKSAAKDVGITVKSLEELYDNHAVVGAPVKKLVRVSK